MRSPMNRLTAEQKQDVLQTVVHLNGGKSSIAMTAAVSKETNEFDIGDWNDSMQACVFQVGPSGFLQKRSFTEPTQLSILEPSRPDFIRNFCLHRVAPQLPLLA